MRSILPHSLKPMQYPAYNSGETILSIGEWYPFRILNLIQLQDEAFYYVLQDVNGLKHFLPSELYQAYGFKVGDVINCKIDAINCTGRIFLEPQNPVYTEGKTYWFELIHSSENEKFSSILVLDLMGNRIQVPVCNINIHDLLEQKKISCRVQNIRKGMLLLELAYQGS